jgi:hypothetical protein
MSEIGQSVLRPIHINTKDNMTKCMDNLFLFFSGFIQGHSYPKWLVYFQSQVMLHVQLGCIDDTPPPPLESSKGRIYAQ